MSNATTIVPVARVNYNDTDNYWPIPSTAGTYYPGAMLGVLATDGKAYKFDDTQALIFLGINTTSPRKVIDATTPSADLFLRYGRPRLFSMPIASGTPSRLTDIGKPVYATDDNHVTTSPNALNYANLVGYVADILPTNPTDTTTSSGGSYLIVPAYVGAGRLDFSGLLVGPATGGKTYGIESLNKIIELPNTAAQAITLPAISSTVAGDTITFIKTTAAAYANTLTAAGTDTINGAATYAMGTAQYSLAELISDGTQWLVDIPSLSTGSTTFSGAVAVSTGGITITTGGLALGGTSTNNTITIPATTAVATSIYDGTTNLVSVDSRLTVAAGLTTVAIQPPASRSLASGTITYANVAKIAANTVTLSGTSTITALDGLGLYVDVPTFAGTAATVTTVSNLYVGLPVTGGSVTLTNIYAAHFAGAVLLDGGLNVSAAAFTATIKANTAASAVLAYDGTTNIVSVDTRNTIKNVHAVTITGVPVTVASEGAAHQNASLNLAAKTITYSGGTTTTSSFGAMLNVGVATFTDSSSCTLTAASAIHINAIANAGGSLTITNSYMISTSVSDCYLTNAGVWTSHSSSQKGKKNIEEAQPGIISRVLEALRPVSFQYREEEFGDDSDRQRVGILAEELPEALQVPGNYPKGGLADGVIGSFALAALRMLWDENRTLKDRLAVLEMRLA